MGLKQNDKSAVNQAILKEIIRSVNSLEYGYVQITVHNSKIVQIDKTEKTRFDDIWLLEKGGGIQAMYKFSQQIAAANRNANIIIS